MNSNEKIINIIKARRKELKLSLSETARRMGIPKSTLSRYESLERQFPLNQISNVAKVLNISIDDILGLEIDTTAKSNGDGILKNLSGSDKELLLKLSKINLDNTIVDTAEIMAKSDERLKKQIYRYAKLEYSEYQKDLEQKNFNEQDDVG